jgi:phosphoribosylformimino-5-aminoimidazole carboxamide ribotide isomerase
MILFPAIDIKNGQCVRLRQGSFQDVLVYSDIPLKIAKQWEAAGASFIHIVDLDGALVGHSVNDEVIKEIVSEVNIPIQVGGGIRTIKDIENKLSLGIERVIIGTKAVKDPAFIKEAIATFGAQRIVIGIDAKEGIPQSLIIFDKAGNTKVVIDYIYFKVNPKLNPIIFNAKGKSGNI